MQKFLRDLNKIIEEIIFVTLFLTVAVCFAQVFTRFVLNSSIKWSDEVSRFLFIICIFMGGIINSRDNQHTAIDLIVNLLPQKLNYGYRMMINTISAFFCLAFAGAGVMWVQKANSQVSSILRIPMHYLYLVTVICGAFMALNIFSNMVNEHRKQKSQKGDKVHEF